MTLVGLKNNNFTVVPMTKVPTSHNGGWFSPTQIRYNGSNTDMMVGTLFFKNTPTFLYGSRKVTTVYMTYCHSD